MCSIVSSTLSRLIDLSFNVIIFSELFISEDHRKACILMCIFMLYHGMCLCIKCMCTCVYVWHSEKKSVWVFVVNTNAISVHLQSLIDNQPICCSMPKCRVQQDIWTAPVEFIHLLSSFFFWTHHIFISLPCSSIRSVRSYSKWFPLITFSSRIMLSTLHLTEPIRTSADRETLRSQTSANNKVWSKTLFITSTARKADCKKFYNMLKYFLEELNNLYKLFSSCSLSLMI